MEAARKCKKTGAAVTSLRKGDRVVITQGDMAGHYATVIDPVAIPDGEPNQRKVLVLTEDESFEMYILPRQLELAEQQHKEHNMTTQTAAVVDSMVPHAADRPIVKFEQYSEIEHITDPMDPALDSWRPDPKVVDDYISRKVHDYVDTEFLLHMREQRDDNGYSPNVALVGATQTGKTHLVQVLAVLAAKRDGLPKPYPVFTLNGASGISNYDLFGKTTAVLVNGQEVLVWMDGVVPIALRCGGILYLDEWNAVPAGQAVSLHPVLDDRRQFTNTHRPVPMGTSGNFMPEIVKANTNLWVISTINPLGYKGTQAMAEATSNRFRWMPWDYDEDVEKALLTSDAVRDFARLLRDAHPHGIKTPVGTSALYRLNEDLSNFGADVALWVFRGMFQTVKDQIAVDEIIEQQDIRDRLAREYDDRVIEPGS